MIRRFWSRGDRLTAAQVGEIADAADRYSRLKVRKPLYIDKRPSGDVLGIREVRQERGDSSVVAGGTGIVASRFVGFATYWGGFGTSAAETMTVHVLDDDGFFTVPVEVALPFGVRPPPNFSRNGIQYTYFSPQSRSARRLSDGLTIVQFLVAPYIVGDLILIAKVGASAARAVNTSTGALRDNVAWIELPGQWARGWVQS